MKASKLVSAVSLFSLLTIFASCTENPKDNDPTSTITPGNNLTVDSVTAHTNNTDSITQLKNANKTNSAKNPADTAHR